MREAAALPSAAQAWRSVMRGMRVRFDRRFAPRAAWSVALWTTLAVLSAWLACELPKHPQTSHLGDDSEYLLMTESFVRHGSPEFQVLDIFKALGALPPRWQHTIARKYFPNPLGYFRAADGRSFCWHFWTYPAFVAWVDRALYGRRLDTRAFGYANGGLFCAALWSFLQLRRSPRLWLLLLPLAFFSPLLWFLPLAHTEPFVFSLGLAASICYLRQRYLLAILLNSIAATQFQPLALLSVSFCVTAFATRLRLPAVRQSGLYWAAALAGLAITLVPSAFYFHHYGVTSLIARERFAAARFMSLDKFLSMFIDLNDGMLTYLPGLLCMLIWALPLTLRRALQTRSAWHLLPWAFTMAVLWSATSALGWNFQTQGVSRYALYAVPGLLLLIAVELRARATLHPSALACIAIAFGLQLWVHASFGWLKFRGHNCLHHNELAEYVLERWPSLYNPPPELFCARTTRGRCFVDQDTGLVREQHLPVIFFGRDHRPLKALAVTCDPERLLAAARWTPEQQARIRERLAACPARIPIYIDF